ncbi:MAG: chromosomal replication initiator protein DnaA [Coriobacteriia bacterium]|nr:chromosomal replication initiator protein DnaA [Coriobacteriia bacterium]
MDSMRQTQKANRDVSPLSDTTVSQIQKTSSVPASSAPSSPAYESADALWADARNLLESRAPASRWGLILSLTPLPGSTPDHLRLGISNNFSRDLAETTCKGIIIEVLNSLIKHPVEVTIETDEALAETTLHPPKEGLTNINDLIPKDRPVVDSSDKSNFDPKFTFDSFVVGDQNAFARNAALAVAEAPALKSGFNPLFIWGSSGLGKTHLLQAIGSYVKEIYPEKKVIYTTSEEFTNQYINASTGVARTLDTEAFRNHYRTTDILLIDDIQFLERKYSTVEQLYFTIDFLKGRGKQIVIAADRSPLELDMDERYTSRFGSGLQVDIQPPQYETRYAIITKFLESEKLPFSTDAIAYIAEQATGNIREMEGALTRIIAFAELTHKEYVSQELAELVAKELFKKKIVKPITIAQIQAEVCRYFSINHTDLIGSKRKYEIVFPRHIAMYLCQELTDSSFPQIGRAFGGKDHTTVMHAVNKIKKVMSCENDVYQQVQHITSALKMKN